MQILTFGRVPLIFVFPAVALAAGRPLSGVAFGVAFGTMLASALTDLLDGYFARKLGVASRLGAYADPLTDKVFYLTSLPTLVYLAGVQGERGHAGLLLVMTIFFLLRDQWVSFMRSIGALYQSDARANWSGKARTLVAFPAICVAFYHLGAPASWPLTIPVALVWGLEIASIGINAISIWVYTRHYGPALLKEMSSDH